MWQQTALCRASYRNREGVVKMLLQHGASLPVMFLGNTPLLASSIGGASLTLTQILLTNGAEVNAVKFFIFFLEENALNWAIVNRQEAVVKLLLKHHAKLKLDDS